MPESSPRRDQGGDPSVHFDLTRAEPRQHSVLVSPPSAPGSESPHPRDRLDRRCERSSMARSAAVVGTDVGAPGASTTLVPDASRACAVVAADESARHRVRGRQPRGDGAPGREQPRDLRPARCGGALTISAGNGTRHGGRLGRPDAVPVRRDAVPAPPPAHRAGQTESAGRGSGSPSPPRHVFSHFSVTTNTSTLRRDDAQLGGKPPGTYQPRADHRHSGGGFPAQHFGNGRDAPGPSGSPAELGRRRAGVSEPWQPFA